MCRIVPYIKARHGMWPHFRARRAPRDPRPLREAPIRPERPLISVLVLAENLARTNPSPLAYEGRLERLPGRMGAFAKQVKFAKTKPKRPILAGLTPGKTQISSLLSVKYKFRHKQSQTDPKEHGPLTFQTAPSRLGESLILMATPNHPVQRNALTRSKR